MEFKENVKKAVTDTAQTVMKKTGEFVENSKTKYSIFDLNNEIERVYKEIGEKIYQGYKNDEDISEFVKEKCAEIDELSKKSGYTKAEA